MSTQSNQGTGITQLQHVTRFKVAQSRKLREEMTPAEEILWSHLRNRQVHNLKIRRQQIIEGFIVDFYCASLQLVIEVDGGIHQTEEQHQRDIHRQKVFEARGLREIRFSNEQVINDIQSVFDTIVGLLHSSVVFDLTPSPSP